MSEIEETMLKKIICEALRELYYNDKYLIHHDQKLQNILYDLDNMTNNVNNISGKVKKISKDLKNISKDLENISKGLKNSSVKVKEYVSERAIVFRFGIYLHELMCDNECLKHYHLDCEYNRNMDHIKTLEANAIVPDMIIHKRGSMEENLLVMEIKTWWNENNNWDKEKIEKLTDPKGDYKYKFGLSIIIEKEVSPELYWISAEHRSFEPLTFKDIIGTEISISETVI